jgi:pilus assembly protein Flp/PilA
MKAGGFQGRDRRGFGYSEFELSVEIAMKSLTSSIKRFLRDEEGVTAIEYGLIAALIAVVLIAGASAAGTALNDLFNDIADCLEAPAACAAPAPAP